MKNILIAVGCVVTLLGSGVVMAGADSEKGQGGAMACKAGACKGDKGEGAKSDKDAKAKGEGKACGGEKGCGGEKSKDGAGKSGSNEKTAGGDNGCGK